MKRGLCLFLIICIPLGVAFAYNALLTCTIILARIISELVVFDNNIYKKDAEEILSQAPDKIEEIKDLMFLDVARDALCVCFIVLFYNIGTIIFG
jgi:hypothetical protein